MPSSEPTPPNRVSFAEALRVWLKIGLMSFGGPAGQIALMHKELVEQRKWIDEERFLHALNYCMLLPGPEAQQLATYIGWLMHRTKGGLAAGILFVLPGFVAVLALSAMYARFHQLPIVAILLYGPKAAVLAVIIEAILRVAKRSLKTKASFGIAAAAFIALFFFDVAFPSVVLAAALLGLMGSRMTPQIVTDSDGGAVASDSTSTVIDSMNAAGELDHTRPSRARALKVLVLGAVLWAGPIAVLAAVLGPTSVFVQEGLFFSKTAAVTFGGAYSVLAYVAQRAVQEHGWLVPGEMLDGLGMAETTPGPLILVLQFVGFLAAYRNPGALPPTIAGVLGACVTVWVTFVPCFIWIFWGAPYIEALRGNRSLRAALSAITASVVGVIANLSVWFAMHVIFRAVTERRIGPIRLLSAPLSSVDPGAIVLASLAMIAIFKLKLGLPKTLALSVIAGWVWKSLF